MNLYNSLTRKKEIFEPLNSGEVKMYSCGPTVYQTTHIGNFRTYTMVDLLHRVLLANGYKVKYITNITDVGHLTGDNFGDSSIGTDRMENAAKQESRSIWEIAEQYTNTFINDYKKMNLLLPEKFVKATDHIKEQIELIQNLEKKGFTYKISDGIYFDTSKFPNYGQISDLDPKDIAGRIDENTEKKNKRDFALWKFNTANEKRQMEWDSPWGIGFPGWHIECSAMSMKYLGQTLDIHCGGEDLRSTHHPNEIAQSESVTGKIFSRFWFHVAFLLIDGKRMGKSLNNAYSVTDLEKKGYDAMVLKYFYYTGHYQKKINLTDEALDSARNALEKLRKIVSAGVDSAGENNKSLIVKEKYDEFLAVVSDDLNTAKGLAVLWSIAKDKNLSPEQKAATILECDNVLGLQIDISSKK
ncbi:MAG TPA: cysteine--tRNA ligase [Candidatus Paceibacterota bacterium]|nr:cysteine--tRNA ligase [Candidatus Paceibacterota bacterium]